MSMRKKEFRLLLTILLVLLGVQVKAEDHLSIQSAEITAGEEFDLPISLVNDSAYKAFQMEIVLPQGITPVYEDEELVLEPTSRMHKNHGFTDEYRAGENILGLVCVSLKANPIKGNEGELFSVKLKAADDLQPGTYEIKLTGVKFTTVANNGFELADATATFTVSGGSVPPVVEKYTYQFVSDGIVLASGELTEGETLTAPVAEKEGYTFKGWDPEFTGRMPASDVIYQAVFEKIVVVEDFVSIQLADINAGDEFTLPVELVNSLEYKAFQMEIVLPQGITPVYEDGELMLEPTSRMHKNHSFTDEYRAGENILGLVCVSLKANPIKGNEGELFSVRLKADASLKSGTYEIKLTGVKFTTTDNSGRDLSDATATFTVSGGSVPPVVEKYTYQFVSDGIVLASGELTEGETLTAPTVEKDGYIFKGWNPEFTGTMPANNVVYQAVFEKQIIGQEFVSIQSAEVSAGDIFALAVGLDNERTYKAFQMDIVLPEGITPVVNVDGKFEITKDAERMGGTDHNIVANYMESTRTLKLVCTSMSSDAFYKNSGNLFYVTLKASSNVKSGTYEVKLTGVKFTSVENTGYAFADATSAITVSGSVPPVVEKYTYQFVSDGIVLASGESEAGEKLTAPVAEKEGYTFKGWDPAFTGMMPANNVVYQAVFEKDAVSEEFVSIQSVDISAGDAFTLAVGLDNERTYKAFQMDIVLPEGVMPYVNGNGEYEIIKDAERMGDTDHSIVANYVESTHTLKLVCTSMSGSTFYKNSGTLFSVALKSSVAMTLGTYNVKLTGVKFTSIDNKGYAFADAAATVVVSGSAPVVEKYIYQFVCDSIVIASGELEAGEKLTAPVAPEKEGYTFKGWNPVFTGMMPAYNVVYQAVYEENVVGENYVTIQSAEISAGDEFELPIELVNTLTFKAFQMEIVLPQGITPVYNEDDELEFEKTGRMHKNHDVTDSYRADDNILGLVCVSLKANAFKENSGALFSVKLKADDNLQPGTYEIKLTGVKFTTTDNTGYEFADAKAIVTVSDAGRIEALQAQLTELISTLNGLMESKMTNWVRTELNDAIENYKNAADVNTLQEGIEELTWMIEWAQASVNNYADLATRLEQLHGMLEDNGVRDPQILKDAQAYYNDILAQWNAEELDEEGIWQATEMISYYINQLNKVALTINVEEAGTLRELILQQVADYSSIIGLTVTGNINDEDLTVFSEMRNNLVTLNLEETNLTNINGWLLTDMYVLKTLVLPKNLVTLSDYAFQNCTVLENISFPATLKTIGNYAFAYCYALTKVEIPEGVEYLGYCSFAYCSGLQEVILPSTLNYCDRAFWYSNQITKITCKAVVPPSTYGQLMRGNESLCTLEVPVISVQTYQNTSYWNYFNIVGGSYYGDNMVLTSDITLNANDSVLAAMKPSITLTKTNNDDWSNSYAALYVEGSNTLSLNNFEMFYDPYMAFRTRTLGYDQRFSTILINDAPMRADNVSAKLRLNAYQWFFVSMPFDAKVSNITSDRDVPYVIYKYDGKRRADGDMENTWVKMTADSTLRAGVGYIWQAASYYDENYGDRYDITFTLKAQNNSNKNNIFRTGNAEVQLTEYVSEFPHNRSWNLVGNPFAAYFNSRAMDITAPFTVWNVENQNYEAFSPIDDSYIFAPGEAFFIQRPADQATIEFLAAGRQNSCYKNNEVFFNNSRQSEMTAKRSVFNLMLQQDNKTLDRTRIVINKQAELGYESDKDAAKFEAMTKVSQIYTIVDGQHYAINERPIGNGEMVLGAEFAMKGTYTLILETSAEEKVYLIDRLTGAEVLMTEDGYTFEAEAGIANGRFLVRVDSDEVTGIRSIDNSESEDAYYDLRGVRVQKPHKGLYINNGKKTVVK